MEVSVRLFAGPLNADIYSSVEQVVLAYGLNCMEQEAAQNRKYM
jgi:hypothetical protein